MQDDANKLANLLSYVQSDGRICPMPDPWNELWQMLPNKERVGSGWKPALPLILGAWWYFSPKEKQFRLKDHIEYAAEHGVLNQVDEYLRGLSPNQWFFG